MIGDHKKAVLQFSGGKDSLALLYLARPYLDRIEVHYADTGAAFPHVSRFVHDVCSKLGANLKVVRPPMAIESYQGEYGLPTDLLPVWQTTDTEWTHKERRDVLQSTVTCCANMLWFPLHRAAYESGATLVLRGAKECDDQRGKAPGYTDKGVTFDAPLWAWSDRNVIDYLDNNGVELPEHYKTVNSSLDCWLCTGHTTAPHAPGHLKYLKENYPVYLPAVIERAKRVRDAVNLETSKLNAAFAELEMV
jgi:3'-phosphoadenosine 5'-phosphosulfate sulfotransferase (PAPS reductase)/FAD synthetase